MAQTMRAAIVTGPQRLVVDEVAVPRPGPGQVCVRLEGCGVCASNLPPWEGRPWFAYPLEPGGLGHEGWGRVDVVGADADGFVPGDRVALLSQHAYAEYDVAPVDALVRLPAALNGQPFPGEPLGCALNIFRRSQIQAGETVAIVGIGFLGALLVGLAVRAGARVIAVTRRSWALQVARKLGACETLLSDDPARVVERVGALTNGALCSCVIEAVGKQEPLDLAGRLTGVRGRLVIAGYHQDGPRQVDMQQWNWRGLDVINAHERDPQVYVKGMHAAADAVAESALNPAPLYTHTFALEQLGDAFALTRDRPNGFLKALVTFP